MKFQQFLALVAVQAIGDVLSAPTAIPAGRRLGILIFQPFKLAFLLLGTVAVTRDAQRVPVPTIPEAWANW